MKVLTVLTVLCVPAWAVPAEKIFSTIEEVHGIDARIIDGTPASIGQFPWQVAIEITTEEAVVGAMCGGSLISNQWVLTAAHCILPDAILYQIYLGGTNLSDMSEGLLVNTTDAIGHPLYNRYVSNNDIALLKLRDPVEFTDNIKAIRLQSRDAPVIGPDEVVTISGFGKTSDASNSASPILNFVELTTITNDDCIVAYGRYGIYFVLSSTLCAVGNPNHSACMGDGGGGLVQYDNAGVAIHVGVFSFFNGKGCASGKPSAYIRTGYFLNWIAQETGLEID